MKTATATTTTTTTTSTPAPDAFEVGCTVEVQDGPHEGEQGEFLSLQRGWARVLLESGEEASFRLSALQVLADEDEADAAEQAEDDADLQDADEADEDEDLSSPLARQIRKYRGGYTPGTNASGSKTLHCGDVLAQLLLSLEPLQVAWVADALLEQPTGWHEARYSALNPGQVRMNCGNKLRAAYKKGTFDLDGFEAACRAALRVARAA